MVKIKNALKYFLLPVLKYLSIFIPMTLLILLPIYYFGGELGNFLIEKFGITTGLYIRPLVIAVTFIALLFFMSTSNLEKINELLWFKQFSKEKIKALYKTYILGLSSFASLTLLIVIKTTFFYAENDFNWFNSRNYLFGYLLLILFFTPLIFLVKRKKISSPAK